MELIRIAMPTWGIRMELLRIAMRAPCRQGKGSLHHAHVDGPSCDVPSSPDIPHPEFCPGDIPPSPDISHPVDISEWEWRAFQLPSQSNSEDFSSKDERLGSLSLGVKKAGPTLGKASDLHPLRCTSLSLASLWEVRNFVDYSLNQGASAGHESADTESLGPKSRYTNWERITMTTRGVPSPTSIHFTIDGRHGILEARHITEALHIPFESVDRSAFRQWSPVSQRDMVCILSKRNSTDSILLLKKLPPGMFLVDVVLRSNLFPLQHLVQRRKAILDAVFCISEGFYFGPHHLIMASFVHFEEKVHRKKLQRVDTIPLLFSRFLCQILEYMGFPTKPWLEHHRLCREPFTLDKWNQLASYSTPLVPPQTEQGELLTETIPLAPTSPTSSPPVSMPEATSTTPPLPYESYCSTSCSYYILAFHHHLCFGPDLPASSEALTPTKDTILVEDTTTVKVQIPPPQEATTNAITSDNPQNEPQIVNTVTTTPEDASSPPEATTT
ncbi:hypothetical protein CK203_113469 [Vitis vinifera]|uniref:Uncharacterized protein n=1 Tax=Vitis vinifera TaxID=29760 RepID=A0A438C8L5_VITVI|nr:hypothetical protein CK203_113469 [Vitis vinifera]